MRWVSANERSQEGFRIDRVLGHGRGIVAGLLIGYLSVGRRPFIRVAGAASVLMAVYSLTLAHTPLCALHRIQAPPYVPCGLHTVKTETFQFAMARSCLHPTAVYFTPFDSLRNEMECKRRGQNDMARVSELLFMLTLHGFFAGVALRTPSCWGMFAMGRALRLFGTGNSGADVWLLYLGDCSPRSVYDFFFVSGKFRGSKGARGVARRKRKA